MAASSLTLNLTSRLDLPIGTTGSRHYPPPSISRTFVPHARLRCRLRVVRFSPKFVEIRESFLRFSGSAILLLGLSLCACSPASARLVPAILPFSSVTVNQDNNTGDEQKSDKVEEFEDDELKRAFEAYKSKVYSLTVPLNVVALRGSVPPSWIKDFISSQGKRLKFNYRLRGSLEEMFSDLSMPLNKVKATSTVAADIVTVGDSWLSFAIKKGLIEPMNGLDDQDWYNMLSDKWKMFLRRNAAGEIDMEGEIWAVPYRWGSMVIAYKKSKFERHNLAPIEDWADLWRPELAGRISMINSPREVIGAVLKYMGASYNTKNIDLHVAGGRQAVAKHLMLLAKQVRLFDSTHYLKAFGVGDVWVAVGWSSDVLPVAKRMSDVAVIIPKSGASLWADLWAIPAASGLGTDKIGGRVRGPSPLIYQWVEFCLQAARSLPFIQEVIPGASPSALDNSPPKMPNEAWEGNKNPRLESNLIAGVPPLDILSKCEFLEPLPETTLSEYQSLIASIQKPSPRMLGNIQDSLSSVLSCLQQKLHSYKQ